MRMRPATSRKTSRQDYSGGFGASLEDQNEVFVELDHGGFPGWALVEPGGVIGIIVRDPFPDGLPGGFDRVEGLIRPPRTAGSP